MIASCDWIVLAVKPRNLLKSWGPPIQMIRWSYRSWQVGISHPGYRLDGAVVRVMPNFDRIGHGATVGYAGPNAGVDVKRTAQLVFSRRSLRVAATGGAYARRYCACWSGPAFIFKVIKALVDSATALGLDAEASRSLAFTMVTGSSELARGTNQSLDELCDSVASPGGTTRAGLSVLDERNLETHIGDAVKAATHRSYELAGR